MKPSLSDMTLAIMASTPLAQVGVAHVVHSLNHNVQCVVTAPTLGKLLAKWATRKVNFLVVVLAGLPEEIAHDTQQLLLLAKFDPALRILVYTYCREVPLLACLNATPQISLLARQESYEQTCLNMERALTGVKVCSQSIDARLREVPPIPLEPSTIALTQAEQQVLKYLLQGLSLSKIASLLHRSIKTISAHKCNGMRKLGARNDSELFRHLHYQVANMPHDTHKSSFLEMVS